MNTKSSGMCRILSSRITFLENRVIISHPHAA
jgi:hypothetical protein